MKREAAPKLYHSIKEIGEMFDEEQHILRYWEREFSLLRPQKNRAGNRVYTEKEIRVLRVIKKLLRQDRMSISAAKDALRNGIPNHLVEVSEQKGEYGSVTVSVKEVSVANSNGDVSSYVTLKRSEVERLVNLLTEVATQLEKL